MHVHVHVQVLDTQEWVAAAVAQQAPNVERQAKSAIGQRPIQVDSDPLNHVEKFPQNSHSHGCCRWIEYHHDDFKGTDVVHT